MSDEDEADRALSALCALGEAAEHVRLEAAFLESPDGHDKPCPMPNEVHPAYSAHGWLVEWINRRGPFADRWEILVPVPMPRRMSYLSPDASPADVFATMPKVARLTRKRCWGLAPYVGEPFVYTWDAGIDEYGRAVASEATPERLR